MSTFDTDTMNEIQEQVLTTNVTDNPLMPYNKIARKNKQLNTNNKAVIQAVNELFSKSTQVEKYTTDSVIAQNKIIGDAINDPDMLNKLKGVAPTIIDALVNTKNQIDDLLQFILDDYEDVFNVTDAVAEFPLTHVPIGKIKMYINGMRQFRTTFEYNKDTNTISWLYVPEKGGFDIEDSEVVFEYDYNRELEQEQEEGEVEEDG